MAAEAGLSTLNSQPSTAQLLGILHKWGIHTLGQLAALNKEELRDRLGSDAVGLWERANGTASRPLKLVQPPETFDESFEFDHEIETAEPLLFILRRFLEQLSLRLSSIYLVARELRLTIHFSGSSEEETTASLPRRTSEKAGAAKETHVRVFKIPQPTNDVDLLFRMLHTHLENFKSDHPIVAVALSAEPIRPVSQQFGLFETALRNPHQLYETLARLTALVGNDRVGSPVLEETHRPDAFRMEAFDWSRNDECRLTNDERKSKPALRRFRPPTNAAIFISQDRHLQSDKVRGQILNQVGPFLLSGNWWDEKSWTRAEWDMQLENGPPCISVAPAALDRYPCGFTGHVARPARSIHQSYGVTGGVIVRAHEAEGIWKLDGIYD